MSGQCARAEWRGEEAYRRKAAGETDRGGGLLPPLSDLTADGATAAVSDNSRLPQAIRPSAAVLSGRRQENRLGRRPWLPAACAACA